MINLFIRSSEPLLTNLTREHTQLENTTTLTETKKDLTKGLVFMKQRDVLLTKDTWTIVVTIATDDYDQVLERVEELFKYLDEQRNITEIQDLIPFFELSRLEATLQSTRQQVSNLKLLLPNSERSKRGLIDGVGTALKFLFGTLNDEDYKELNNKIEKIEDNGESLVHVESDRLTYMRKLTNEVDGNSKAIQLLVNSTKNTIISMSNVNFTLWSEIQQLKEKLNCQSKISSIFREIELTLSLVDKQLIQLQEALDVTSTGYLSSVLIPPAKLTELLKEIVLKLPVGLSLIVKTELDKIYSYYQIVNVHAISIKNVIRLVIDIPLQNTHSNFELYNVKSLPYFDNTLAQFLQVKSESQYLAVATNRQSYTVLSQEEVNKCLKPPYGICLISAPLYIGTACQHCAYALFIGDQLKILQLCKREVLTNFQTPILYAGPDGDYWIYSTPIPIKSVIKCPSSKNDIREITREIKLLNGTGMIQNIRNCHVYSNYFTLMPFSNRQSYGKIQANHIIVPPIESILTPSEKSLFSQHAVSAETDKQLKKLTTIQDLINNHTEKVNTIDLETLERKLELIRSSQRPHTTSDVSLSFIMLIALIAAVVVTVCLINSLQYPAIRNCLIPRQQVTLTPSAPPVRTQTAVIYEEIQPDVPGRLRFIEEPATSV